MTSAKTVRLIETILPRMVCIGLTEIFITVRMAYLSLVFSVLTEITISLEPVADLIELDSLPDQNLIMYLILMDLAGLMV